jgi:hypothetical protein
MDARDHGEQETHKNSICRLEWIAWAIEAARRHKEAEQMQSPPKPRRTELRLVEAND